MSLSTWDTVKSIYDFIECYIDNEKYIKLIWSLFMIRVRTKLAKRGA